MEKILITGGAGFIGSAVVNYLLEKQFVTHILDDLSLGKNHWLNNAVKPQLHVESILNFDACDKIFKDVRPDVVIHLAANHYIPFCEKNLYAAYNLNVVGTLNILELCKKHNIQKFFFASTGDVYAPGFAPHREVDTVSPIYVYGHTKYLGEQLCIKYFESDLKNSSVIIGRLFNAVGPRETNPHLIPDVVKQIVAGKRRIEVGNIWPKRDFVDVFSMATIIAELTLQASGIEVINIGSGVVIEVGEALNILKSALTEEIQIVSIPEKQRPNDRPYLCPDVHRLKKIHGSAAQPFNLKTAQQIFAEFNSKREPPHL